MAVYRKQPTFFNVPSKPQRQSKSFVPFAGLEINDNPLLNTESSASDMLNMVVDDNYFLTLRPRLENDASFQEALRLLNEALIYDGNEGLYTIRDAIKIKNKYFFLVSFFEENPHYESVSVCDVGTGGVNYAYITSIDDTLHIDRYHSFEEFVLTVEGNFVRMIHKTYFGSNVLALTDDAPSVSITDPYTPTYKANIISKETLVSAPIYEDLNVLSPYYKILFQFSEGQEDTFRTLRNQARIIEGSPYSLNTLYNFSQAVTNITLLVKLKNFDLTLRRDRTRDKYVGSVFYYGWTETTINAGYFTLYERIFPKESIYNSSMTDVTINNRVGDVTVVSYPTINRTDIIDIKNNEVIYVDGGKASAILNSLPTRIYAGGLWLTRKYSSDGTKYGNYYYAWQSAALGLYYTSDTINLYEIYAGQTVYTDSGSAMTSFGTISQIDWPITMYVPFYKVNTTTKLSYEFFRLYVNIDGPLGEYLSRNDFLKLFSTEIQYDNNGRRLGKFIYDADANALVRLEIPTAQRMIKTAREGGAPSLSSFTDVKNPIREVYLHEYVIGDSEIHTKILKIDTSRSLPVDAAYNRWRVCYFDGQVVVIFDGTFKGTTNAGLSIMRTTTRLNDPNFNKFYDVLSGIGTSYSGSTTTIFPQYPRDNSLTAQQFEIVSHIVYDGTNVHVISPYDFVHLFNPMSTAPFIDDSTTDSARMVLHINGSTSSSIDLTALTKKRISTNRRNASVLVDGQFLLYSLNNSNGRIKTDVIVIDLSAIASARGYTLPTALDGYSGDIISLNIDIGGQITAIIKHTVNYSFAKYVLDFNYNDAITDYYVFTIAPSDNSDMYAYRGNFALVNEMGGIRVLELSTTPIELTYLIENNDINPLRLPKEVIDAYTVAKNAYYNTNYPLIGSSYVGNARVYYKENYVFITNGDNYVYLPVIYSHKPQRKVRHVSPYLREVAAIFEQNMIEFVTLVENPFVATAFINHALLPIFEKYEQLSIDYTDTKHLVTFFDNTVYLSRGGLYSLTFEPNTSQENVRKATLVSKVVNAKLTKEDISTAILANSDPYILIMFPDAVNHKTKVYAYRADYTHWYYWELPIVVLDVQDDNLDLRLHYIENGEHYLAYLVNDPIKSEIDESLSSYEGNVERYLDFDRLVIPWFWKSQLLALGSITKQKQLIETYFTFVNNNASIVIDTENNFDVVSRHITSQEFGLRYFTYNDIVTVSPKVEFQDRLNIINNIRRRTYLSRFNYCQLLCYNIDKGNQILDKVRLANIVMVYKYLTGGK